MLGGKLVLSVVASVVVGHIISNTKETNEIKNLNASLKLLDDRITEILEEPKARDGTTVIDIIGKFNEDLAQLVSTVCEHNSTFSDNSKLFCRNEGPRFLKLKLDNNYVTKMFNWTEEQLKELYYIKGATEVLWWELKHMGTPCGSFPRIANHTHDDVDYLYQMDKENRLNELEEFTKLDDFQRTDIPLRKPKPL